MKWSIRLIDVPMYEQLLEADVVATDLSTSNRNAIYELGVRHALRPLYDRGDRRGTNDEIAILRFETTL
jgi:hypothetical protein